MNQLRLEAKRLPSLEPNRNNRAMASLNHRPEYRFHRDIIEGFLRRSNMVNVNTTSTAANHV